MYLFRPDEGTCMCPNIGLNYINFVCKFFCISGG